ncbi:response regulator transcription factor [Peribacillus loiseleuriae]|uniref:Chemotaxis protein CheY n=1 Tax=Peribacillus loiseleuriae TaxID=1679170 RepID=A0A0K9GWI4_9BACI|nr:response regulator [Peribacillus loiseleuriae]KMY50978.1 hypothetical protein AC625_16780 [Peribacillus loiseleuriae]
MTYKVLIADDEPLIVKNLSYIIDWDLLGCEVVGTAQNGHEAIEFLEKERIDILLTDISMPGMTGIELLKRVHKMSNKPIIILISGYDEFEYAREGLKYDALDYILKPIDYDELHECILRAIEKLSKQVIGDYERRKHVIYELMTFGPHESNVANSFNPYVALIIKSKEKDIDHMIKKSNDLFLKMTDALYLYKISEQEAIAIIEFASQMSDQTARNAELFARQIQEVSKQSVVAIGRTVDYLFDIKTSLDHARELIKIDSLVNENIITSQLLNGEYKSRQSSQAMIHEAITYIKDYFQNDLGIENVAEHVGLSVSYFSLLFKQVTEVTFLEFLTNVRVEYACLLLQKTDMKTYEISEKVGYSDQRYFSQVFKKKMKKTPSTYRKECNEKKK